MTTKQKLFSFPFRLPGNLLPSPSLIRDSTTLGSHNIPFFDSARNLGFILDSKLSMKKHVIKICHTAYFELKRISSIRRFLTEDAAKTCYFLYPLTIADYCNCHLILSSNLSRKFKTLMQDSFSWQTATTTRHLSWRTESVWCEKTEKKTRNTHL